MMDTTAPVCCTGGTVDRKATRMKTPRGEDRRDKILEVAEAIILRKGFTATSIEDIIEKAFITKGGFFYHFPGKAELARALIERYVEEDERLFTSLAERAKTLSEDPLQQLLIFLNLLAETMESLEDLHPGCLVAALTYESPQIDETARTMISESMLRWRGFFRRLIERAAVAHPPHMAVDLDELADYLTSTIEGGIIVSRVLRDKRALPRMIRQYRNHIRLLFAEPSTTTM